MNGIKVPKQRVIRDKAFAKRLETACESHPHTPKEGRGKQKWIYDRLESEFAIKVSAEAARRWFAGETRPKPKTMSAIARILEVDEGWLSLGLRPDVTPREKRERNALATGATNYFAGLVQMAGGHVAFGEDEAECDLFVIMQGKRCEVDVSLALALDANTFRFTVDVVSKFRLIVGIVVGDRLVNSALLSIPFELIQLHGDKRGDYFEVICERRGDHFLIGKQIVPQVVHLDDLSEAERTRLAAAK